MLTKQTHPFQTPVLHTRAHQTAPPTRPQTTLPVPPYPCSATPAHLRPQIPPRTPIKRNPIMTPHHPSTTITMRHTTNATPLCAESLPSPFPFTKWRHFKEAFSPEVVYQARDSSPVPVSSCLDPFGGSGTTPLACQFAGIESTTIEVNPYLADLIEAKLTLYDVEILTRDLGTILHLADKTDPSLTIEDLPETFVEPGVNSRWLFNREVAERILSILLAIASLSSEAHRRLFKVLLGRTLVPLSNAIVNGKGRRYRRSWDKNTKSRGQVDLMFTDAASDAIREIRLRERRKSTVYNLIRGDCRQALKDLESSDLAVFSPPYPNSFDYTDVYNIELWMLGYLRHRKDNSVLRLNTLSSHVQINRDFAPPPAGSQQLDDAIGSLNLIAQQLWNRNIPLMLGAYFAEMSEIVKLVQALLTPGGIICIVVGDSCYAGVPIRVAQILAELSATTGVSVDRVLALREMRKSAQQGGEIQLSENLLVLRTS